METDDATETELCQQPGIALIKEVDFIDTDGDGCASVGETLLFTFQVANVGNLPLTNVTIDDPKVPVNGGPIDLAVGEIDTTTFTAEYVLTEEDQENGTYFFVNQATAEGIASDGTVVTDLSDNDSFEEDDPTIFILGCVVDTTILVAAMEVEKTGVFNDENGDGNSQPGESISYSFTVTNTGELTLFDVTISDPLPGIIIEGGPIAVLEPGESDSETFTARYVITEEDIENGEVVNQATGEATTEEGEVVTDLSDDPTDSTDQDLEGDGDPDDPTVVILPLVESEVEFEIFNGISPDGDGLNDYMQINGIENYPQNNFKVFNRWGVQVFEINGYDNVSKRFEGISEGRTTIRQGERLPAGTYYYVLTFSGDNPGQQAYTGYLYINRN